MADSGTTGTDQDVFDLEVDLEVPDEAHASGLTLKQVSSFMARMELTDPSMLRAVCCHDLLGGFGRVLRERDKSAYRLSKPVPSIGSFISHSWQSSMLLKILLLMLLHNGAPAATAGTLAATVATVFSASDLLPGYVRYSSEFQQEYEYAPWCLAAGLLVALLTFLFWRPKRKVFVDFVCIDQRTDEAKCLGIANVGAVLKNSTSLLVLYDSSIIKRLWCLYEMGAFMKSHEHLPEEALTMRPVFLAPLLSGMILCFIFVALLPLVNQSSPLTMALYAVLMVAPPIVFAVQIKTYASSVEAMRSELKSFVMQNATCSCCESNLCGEAGLCDRKLLTDCVQQWFGSIEEFEACVRSRVSQSLQSHLGQLPLTYSMVLCASTPFLWYRMGVLAGILLVGDLSQALAHGCRTLQWWLLVIPMLFTAAIDMAHLLRRRRCNNCWDAMVIVLTFSLVVVAGLGMTVLGGHLLPSVIPNPVHGNIISMTCTMAVAVLYYCLRPFIKDRQL